MSRVEDQKNKRMETERMQKQADRAGRQEKAGNTDRQQFSSMMKNGKMAQTAQRALGQKMGDARKGEQLKNLAKGLKQNALKNTRLVRQGASQTSRAMDQAQSYHSHLDTKKQESGQHNEHLSTKGGESVRDAHEAHVERNSDIEQKTESKKDIAKADAKAEALKKGQANAAIDGDTSKGDGESGQNDGLGADAAGRAQRGGNAAEEVSKSGRTTEIPEEVMEAMVQEIYVGVDAEGIKMFHIELKEGVFGGGSLQVKADGGKVRLNFAGIDSQAQNLIHASRGDLMRRLEGKGLMLDDIAFG